MFIPLPETKRGAIAKEAVEIILDSTEKQNVVVVFVVVVVVVVLLLAVMKDLIRIELLHARGKL